MPNLKKEMGLFVISRDDGNNSNNNNDSSVVLAT